MTISQYVIYLRKKYVKNGCQSISDINSGYCEDFAEDIHKKFPKAEPMWGDQLPKNFWKMSRNWINWIAAYHCFIEYKGKYYDSESPNGVKHPIFLKCFQRMLQFGKYKFNSANYQ